MRLGRSPETGSAGAGVNESTHVTVAPGDSQAGAGADRIRATRRRGYRRDDVCARECSPASALRRPVFSSPPLVDHPCPDLPTAAPVTAPERHQSSSPGSDADAARWPRYDARHDIRAGRTSGAIGGDRRLRAPGRATTDAPTRSECQERARRAARPPVRPPPQLARTLRRPSSGSQPGMYPTVAVYDVDDQRTHRRAAITEPDRCHRGRSIPLAR